MTAGSGSVSSNIESTLTVPADTSSGAGSVSSRIAATLTLDSVFRAEGSVSSCVASELSIADEPGLEGRVHVWGVRDNVPVWGARS